jgi:hypothetical protein
VSELRNKGLCAWHDLPKNRTQKTDKTRTKITESNRAHGLLTPPFNSPSLLFNVLFYSSSDLQQRFLGVVEYSCSFSSKDSSLCRSPNHWIASFLPSWLLLQPPPTKSMTVWGGCQSSPRLEFDSIPWLWMGKEEIGGHMFLVGRHKAHSDHDEAILLNVGCLPYAPSAQGSKRRLCICFPP